MITKIRNIFTQKYLYLVVVLYCGIKIIPVLRNISFFTYIIYLYSFFTFLNYILYDLKNLLFKYCYIFYGYFIVAGISLYINGIPNIAQVMNNLLPIFTLMFVIMPKFNYKNKVNIEEEIDLIMKYMFYVFAVIAILNVFSFVPKIFIKDISFPLFFSNGMRFYGIYENVGMCGWGSIFGILSSSYMYAKYKKKIHLLFIILNTLFVILSQSRGIYVSLLVSIFLILWINKETVISVYKKHINVFKYFIFAFVFILLLMLVIMILNRGFTRGTSGRTELWVYSIRAFLERNKLFGASFGMASINWENDWQKMIDDGTTLWPSFKGYAFAVNSHNIYLQQLILHGIFGVLILVSIVVVSIKNLIKLKSSNVNILTYQVILVMFVIPFVMGFVDISFMLNMTSFMHISFSLAYHYALFNK